MKKSRLVLAVVLALILCIACICAPTFSWYTRPNAQSGNKFTWTPDYSISNGEGVSMQTLASSDGGKNYTEPVSGYSSPAEGLKPGECVYYRTAITNSGTASAQSVSLFLSGLDLKKNTDGGKFFIGVNSPLRTYKNCTPTVFADEPIKSYIYRQNVYIGLHSDTTEMSFLTARKPGVHSWPNDSDCSWAEAKDTKKTGDWTVGYWKDGNGNDVSQTFNIYAMEIDSRSTQFQIVDTGGKRDDAMPKISENNTIVYFEWNNGGEYHSQAKHSDPAALIETFYSSARVKNNNTVSIPATGRNVTYTSSDTDVATVDTNGKVTGKSSGTATITATSTGVYGDTVTAQCEVQVYNDTVNNAVDVPIVTNYQISAAADGENAAVEYVYWYIKNDSNAVLKYTISDIYLSL